MKLQKLQSDLFDFAAGDKPTTRPTTAFDLIRDKCKTTPIHDFAYEGSKAFDLAYYSDFPNMKSQLNEYLNVAFMKEMQNEGITSLNAGLASGKGLCQFKDHFPNEILTWYQWK